MYIQASIGRNVGLSPMGRIRWAQFATDTKVAIIRAAHEAALPVRLSDFQVHTGMGEWEGAEEESAHVSVYHPAKPGQVNAARLQEWLADELAHLAREYGQDAIAFVVTDSHLATARDV